MTPEDADLSEMCRRFGVEPAFGVRLRPIVRRAHDSPPERRRFLLDLVERAIAREADRRRRIDVAREAAEERALKRVAGILHAWTPPDWFRRWAKEIGGTDAFGHETADDLDPRA